MCIRFCILLTQSSKNYVETYSLKIKNLQNNLQVQNYVNYDRENKVLELIIYPIFRKYICNLLVNISFNCCATEKSGSTKITILQL